MRLRREKAEHDKAIKVRNEERKRQREIEAQLKATQEFLQKPLDPLDVIEETKKAEEA